MLTAYRSGGVLAPVSSFVDNAMDIEIEIRLELSQAVPSLPTL